PSAVETMAAILHDEPTAVDDFGKKFPRDLERVIAHCLEKNPDLRFQSARDLNFALLSLLSGQAHDRTLPEARYVRPAVWGVAVVAAMTLTGTAWYLWWRETHKPLELAHAINQNQAI